jgi:hypothetical protein
MFYSSQSSSSLMQIHGDVDLSLYYTIPFQFQFHLTAICRRLDKLRHERLKNDYEKYSKQLQAHEDILPLTEDIAALQIGIDELIALKAAMNQAVKLYNLPPLAATLQIIDDIKNIIE